MAKYLPFKRKNIADLFFVSMVIQCQRAGGDVVCIVENRMRSSVYLIILDIMGHGAEASSIHKSISKCCEQAIRIPLGEGKNLIFMENLNKQLLSLDKNKTATCCLLEFKKSTGILNIVNAGHPFPLIVKKDKKIVPISLMSSLLGLEEPDFAVSDQIKLERGDQIIAFSDATYEVKGYANSNFGQKRLRAVLEQTRSKDASVMINAIFDALSTHAGNATREDDLSIVVVSRN